MHLDLTVIASKWGYESLEAESAIPGIPEWKFGEIRGEARNVNGSRCRFGCMGNGFAI